MGKKSKNTSLSPSQLPFVSICTPTFNRRPFIPYMIKCFEHQTYPKDRMEWIIIDDGTDKVEDMLKDVPQIKYFKYDTKMTLGRKRNLMHEKCKGDIIVYMDDDDYYPPERVSHAVEMLQKNPQFMVAGSSEMHIYFKHIKKMYQFGPYGPNHATAATFAFRKEYLKQSGYENDISCAEERKFLKDYSVPMVKLDTLKTILVVSHIHNSLDKKVLLEEPNPYVKESRLVVGDFIKDADIKHFFMEDIESLLKIYEPGRPENKPDVMKQIVELKKKREEMIEAQRQQQMQHQQISVQDLIQNYEKTIRDQNNIIQEIMKENRDLKSKADYLDNKIKQLINDRIVDLKKLKSQESKA
jgi:glycosyltransferase involved in cell wall biosynthesis